MGGSGHKVCIRNGTDETIVIFPADREVTQLWACQEIQPGETKEVHFPKAADGGLHFVNIHIKNREGCMKLKLNINDPENCRLNVIPSSVSGEHLKLQTSICSSQSHTLPSSSSNHGQGSNLRTTSRSSSSSLSTSHSTGSSTFAAASRSSQFHHTPHLGSSTHGQGSNLQTTSRSSSSFSTSHSSPSTTFAASSRSSQSHLHHGSSTHGQGSNLQTTSRLSSSSTSSSSFSTSHSTPSTTFAALSQSSQSHHTPHHGSSRLGEHPARVSSFSCKEKETSTLGGQRRKT